MCETTAVPGQISSRACASDLPSNKCESGGSLLRTLGIYSLLLLEHLAACSLRCSCIDGVEWEFQLIAYTYAPSPLATAA